MAVTPAQVKKHLARLESEYWDGVDRIAERIRRDSVVPFCRRKGWDFCAGMGSWAFHKPGYAAHDLASVVDSESLPKRLRALLELDTLNRGNDLGSLIARDVRASEGFA